MVAPGLAEYTNQLPLVADKAEAPALLMKSCPESTMASPVPLAVSAPEASVTPPVPPLLTALIVEAVMPRNVISPLVWLVLPVPPSS